MQDQIAEPLGLSVEQAAAAVVRIANTHMAGAIRMVSLSLGADPRDFALFAFGGAGPLHAVALARELAVPRVLVPARPGLTNALGCVVADLRHDFVRTVNQPLDSVDIDKVHQILATHEAAGRDLIAAEPVAVETILAEFTADMQFVGQTHLLRIRLPDATPTRDDLQALFEAAYFARFRVDLPMIRANLVNLSVSVIGQRPAADLSQLIARADRASVLTPKARRQVWFDTWVDTPVYWRDHMPIEAVVTGPAIIEQMDTTLLVDPGCRVSTDPDGNLIIKVPHD
jgi:N-methylhydantoinase A